MPSKTTTPQEGQPIRLPTHSANPQRKRPRTCTTLSSPPIIKISQHLFGPRAPPKRTQQQMNSAQPPPLKQQILLPPAYDAAQQQRIRELDDEVYMLRTALDNKDRRCERLEEENQYLRKKTLQQEVALDRIRWVVEVEAPQEGAKSEGTRSRTGRVPGGGSL